jgi:hypothetical protein
MKTTQPLLILIALAFPCAPAFADSSDIPEWYGTIRFTKTLAERNDDPYEFREAKGMKFLDVKVSWSGLIRFQPGGKSVVVASYSFRREADVREDRTQNCPWKNEKTVYHDYQNMLTVTKVTVNREDKNKLAFILRPDGTYKVSVIANGGKDVDKAVRWRTFREIYDECSKPNLDVNDQKGDGSANMESLTLAHVEGKAKPGATMLSGSWTSEDSDRGKLSYSWDLTLAEPQLVARIQATPVVRGASVTLDGKTSTGKIDKYEWQFAPEGDCEMTREGLALKLTGVSVTFKALCDFTVDLKVSNDKASDRAWQLVKVEARKGEAWATKYNSNPGAPFTRHIIAGEISTAGEIFVGKNRCALDPDGADMSHWLHTTWPKNKTWRDVGYVLAQVQDSGPFKGAWYVQSQSLQIDRLERVNSEILPTGTSDESKDHGKVTPKPGSVYVLNVANGNKRDIDDWGAQAKVHEATHSILVKEKLEKLKPNGDPAVVIEKLVGGAGEDMFQTIVDLNVRDIDTVLAKASTESLVAERLSSEGRWNRNVSIWFKGSNGDALKPMGPLWKLGD